MSQQQKQAIKKVSENLRKGIVEPLGKVMLEAGYAKQTSKTPQILTESKLWKKTFEEAFPDKLLVKVGQEGLAATKIHSSHTEPDSVVPDHANRHRFWKDIIDLKGYSKGRGDSYKQVNINWGTGGYRPNIIAKPSKRRIRNPINL